MRNNFMKLAAAGCQHIQIDEPLFTMSDYNEVAAAVDAINLAIEGLSRGAGRMITALAIGPLAAGSASAQTAGTRRFLTGWLRRRELCIAPSTANGATFICDAFETDWLAGAAGVELPHLE